MSVCLVSFRYRASPGAVKLDLFYNNELLSPQQDRRLITELGVDHSSERAVITVKLGGSAASYHGILPDPAIHSSPESSNDVSPVDMPQDGFLEETSLDAERLLPDVWMSQQEGMIEFFVRLADLGSRLDNRSLLNSARDLLGLLPADESVVLAITDASADGSGRLDAIINAPSPSKVCGVTTLIDWLIDRLTSVWWLLQLIDWLIDWLVFDGSFDWLIDWLLDWSHCIIKLQKDIYCLLFCFIKCVWQVLYSLQVLQSLLLPARQSQYESAADFCSQLILKRQLMDSILDLLTRHNFLQNADAITKQQCYRCVLRLVKLVLHIVYAMGVDVLALRSATNNNIAAHPGAGSRHGFTEETLQFINAMRLAVITPASHGIRNVAAKAATLLRAFVVTLPRLDTLLALRHLAWTAASGSLHLLDCREAEAQSALQKVGEIWAINLNLEHVEISVFDWLIDWLMNWLIDWLFDCSMSVRLIDRLIDYSVSVWSIDWLIDELRFLNETYLRFKVFFSHFCREIIHWTRERFRLPRRRWIVYCCVFRWRRKRWTMSWTSSKACGLHFSVICLSSATMPPYGTLPHGTLPWSRWSAPPSSRPWIATSLASFSASFRANRDTGQIRVNRRSILWRRKSRRPKIPNRCHLSINQQESITWMTINFKKKILF